MKILKKITSATKNLAIWIIVTFTAIFLVLLMISCMRWLHNNNLAPLSVIMFIIIFLGFGISLIIPVFRALFTGRLVIWTGGGAGDGPPHKIMDISKETNPTLFKKRMKLLFYSSLIVVIIALIILFLPSYL